MPGKGAIAPGMDALAKLLAINVTGQIAVTQACLPRLRTARGMTPCTSSVSR